MPKLLPKIVVSGVPDDFMCDIDSSLPLDVRREQEKKCILESVCDKNPVLNEFVQDNHTLQVVFVNKAKESGNLTIGFKVSPAIRAFLFNNQKGLIHIGSVRKPVSDRFHIKQCYHCQMLGHISSFCPNKKEGSVCLYCMMNHKSIDCPHKRDASKYSCAKCLHSKHELDQQNYTSHTSTSIDCPVYAREMKRLASMTEFQASKNVK